MYLFDVLKYGEAFWGQAGEGLFVYFISWPIIVAVLSCISAHFITISRQLSEFIWAAQVNGPPIKFDCQTFADISTRTASSNPIFVRFLCLCCQRFHFVSFCGFSRFCFAVKLQIAPVIVYASPALAPFPLAFRLWVFRCSFFVFRAQFDRQKYASRAAGIFMTMR